MHTRISVKKLVCYHRRYEKYRLKQRTILREALKRMDEVFGENKIEYQVYGDLLNDLGAVCHMTSRYEEVASLCKQAIDAFKAVTDYDVEEKRK